MLCTKVKRCGTTGENSSQEEMHDKEQYVCVAMKKFIIDESLGKWQTSIIKG